MPNNVQIYRNAFVLLEHMDELAYDEAMNKAAEVKASGDDEKSNIWLAIARAIADLESYWRIGSVH
jgi:hypothetical protein